MPYDTSACLWIRNVHNRIVCISVPLLQIERVHTCAWSIISLSGYRHFQQYTDTPYHRPSCERGVTVRAAHHFVKLHDHVYIVEYLSAQPCREPLSSEPRLRPVQSSYHRKNHNECFMTYSSTTAGYANFSAVTTSAHHLLVCTSVKWLLSLYICMLLHCIYLNQRLKSQVHILSGNHYPKFSQLTRRT